MKVKNYYLIGSLIILLFSTSICLAQESTTIRILKEGKEVPIADVLTEVDGKKVLVINKGEVVELFVDDGVRLDSSKKDSVEVLNGNILKGKIVGAEAVITAKKGTDTTLTIKDVDKITVKVVDEDASQQVIAQSTFLPYKTVKDNFGKKFAQSYFVIQVDIRNETLDKQFIVQTLDVLVDPNQCYNGRFLYEGFNSQKCIEVFKQYFIFPTAQQGVRREEVIASGKADLNRSNRNVGFRVLAFLSGMGSILTGFNGVLGPDGAKGINVLGTTVTAAANGLFPNSADEKLENLKNAVPTEDVIIKSKESKTFNIFIPTERIFYKDSWKQYIKPARDSNVDTYTLKSVLDLLLLSSATGVLVDNAAPKVQVKSDDNLRRQKEKFALVGEFSAEITKKTDEFFGTMIALKANLDKDETNNNATGLLRNIVIELLKVNEPRFKKVLDDNNITNQSKGEKIFPAIQLLSADLATRDRDEILIAKFQDIIIKFGK